MTDERSLERAARSWIEVGPTAAPPHVVDAVLDLIAHTPQERDWFPWRFPRMPLSARVVALVAIGALILAGAFALLGPGGTSTPLPSPAPSTNPSSAAVASASGLALSASFPSQLYGYSVKYPAGWKAHPATRTWSTGTTNDWGSGYNDELYLTGGDVRFSGTSQTLATGQTADEWLAAYAGGTDRATWPTIPIGGQTGYITADGVAAAGGTIAPGGRMFDAVVVSGDRAYNFNMDGNVDRPTFEAFLATITLDPASVGALPPLDKTFTSPWYGYSIKHAGAWTVRPATAHWQGVDNSPPATDEIVITGTDTTISVASQALGAQTLNEFLVVVPRQHDRERSTRLRRRGSRHMGIDPDRLGNGSLVRAVQCRGGDCRRRWPGLCLHVGQLHVRRRQAPEPGVLAQAPRNCHLRSGRGRGSLAATRRLQAPDRPGGRRSRRSIPSGLGSRGSAARGHQRSGRRREQRRR